MKTNCKNQVKKNLEQKKYLKEKVINCTSNGKGMIVVLIKGLIKKVSYKNESILSEAIQKFEGNINIKVDLPDYATKTDLKNVTHVDTSRFCAKNKFSEFKN